MYQQTEIAHVPRRSLASTTAGERVRINEGDKFQDPRPDDYDVVMLVNVTQLFSPEHNVTLLQRTRERVSSGARLLLVDFWTDPTHTRPTFAALMAGEFQMFTGEGDVYSEEEVSGWLRQTGWQALERKPLAGPASLIVAEAV